MVQIKGNTSRNAKKSKRRERFRVNNMRQHYNPPMNFYKDQTAAPQTFAAQTFTPQTFPSQPFNPQTYAFQAFASQAPQTYEPQMYEPQMYAPQTYAPQTYAPQTYAPQTYAPQTFAPQTLAPQAFSPQMFAPQGSMPQTFGPQSLPPQKFTSQAFTPQTFALQTIAPQVIAPQSIAPRAMTPPMVMSQTAQTPAPSTHSQIMTSQQSCAIQQDRLSSQKVMQKSSYRDTSNITSKSLTSIWTYKPEVSPSNDALLPVTISMPWYGADWKITQSYDMSEIYARNSFHARHSSSQIIASFMQKSNVDRRSLTYLLPLLWDVPIAELHEIYAAQNNTIDEQNCLKNSEN